MITWSFLFKISKMMSSNPYDSETLGIIIVIKFRIPYNKTLQFFVIYYHYSMELIKIIYFVSFLHFGLEYNQNNRIYPCLWFWYTHGE